MVGGPVSLDEVFKYQSMAPNTPKKFETVRRDWATGGALWFQAWRMAVSNESITSLDQLVELVLNSPPQSAAPFRQWPVKKTKAKALITMVDKNQVELLNWPRSKLLSQFLANRRKR